MKSAQEGRSQFFLILIFLILCFLGLSARLLFVYLMDSHRFPINTVKISASYQHVTRQDLENILARYLSQGFFGLDQHALEAELKALPWTNEVILERIWPGILRVVVTEKTPVAFWKEELMTDQGILFHAQDQRLLLPHLFGPESQRMEVLHNYEKLSKLLQSHGLSIAKIHLSANQSWKLTLTNGVLLRLGKKEVLWRAERFCRAYPAVFLEKLNQLVSVDLRYERGMAVQWK